MTFGLWPAGRPSAMTYPSGGRTVGYNYAGLPSQLTSLSDATGTIQSYAYLGTSTPVTFADGNGVTLSYVGGVTQDGTTDAGDRYGGLDRFGRVSDQRWTSASTGTVDDLRYAYDADSNVTLKTNTAISNDIESFGYDGLNRLTSFARYTTNSYGGPVSAAVTEGWSLDAAGNWTQNRVTPAGSAMQTTIRTTDGQNQVKTLTAPGGSPVTLGYDDDGNTLADQAGQQYAYDAWNRLTVVKSSGGNTVASYGYDALGRRTTETHGATTTELYYSTGWQVVEERQGGVATAQYVWSPFYVDGLVERDDHDATAPGAGLNRRLYAEQDGNYNVTSLTDSNGAVKERYEYDPYGSVTVLTVGGSAVSGGASASGYGWAYLHQGLRMDVATGTYSDRSREYSSALGRFLQQDMAGFVDGANTYQKEISNPLRGLDPFGTRTWIEAILGTFFSDDTMADLNVGGNVATGGTGLPMNPDVVNVTSRVSGGVQMVAGAYGAGVMGTMAVCLPDPEPGSHIVLGAAALKSTEFASNGYEMMMNGANYRPGPTAGQVVSTLAQDAGIAPGAAGQIGQATDTTGTSALIGMMVASNPMFNMGGGLGMPECFVAGTPVMIADDEVQAVSDLDLAKMAALDSQSSELIAWAIAAIATAPVAYVLLARWQRHRLAVDAAKAMAEVEPVYADFRHRLPRSPLPPPLSFESFAACFSTNLVQLGLG